MPFKEVGVILGTQGPFRNIVQIKIGNAHSVEFDFLEWWQLHKLYPQDWIVIHTHAPEIGAIFSNKDLEFYKAIQLALYPFQVFFIVYMPPQEFTAKYRGEGITGTYDPCNKSAWVFTSIDTRISHLMDSIRNGLDVCFHLNYLVQNLKVEL